LSLSNSVKFFDSSHFLKLGCWSTRTF